MIVFPKAFEELGELRQFYELLPHNEKHKKPANIERARGEHWRIGRWKRLENFFLASPFSQAQCATHPSFGVGARTMQNRQNPLRRREFVAYR